MPHFAAIRSCGFHYEGLFPHMQARTQKALELSLSYQQKYDSELHDYVQNYNHAHPDSRVRLNGGYCRSIRVWDETLDEYLEICIDVKRIRTCGTNRTRVYQSVLLFPRRHYLRSFIEQTLSAVLAEGTHLSIMRCATDRDISPSTWWKWYQASCKSTLTGDAPAFPDVYTCSI